jgi:hypothetical protein
VVRLYGSRRETRLGAPQLLCFSAGQRLFNGRRLTGSHSARDPKSAPCLFAKPDRKLPAARSTRCARLPAPAEWSRKDVNKGPSRPEATATAGPSLRASRYGWWVQKEVIVLGISGAAVLAIKTGQQALAVGRPDYVIGRCVALRQYDALERRGAEDGETAIEKSGEPRTVRGPPWPSYFPTSDRDPPVAASATK